MKLNGKKLEGPNVEYIVLPRGSGVPDVVFHAGAVLDVDAFTKLCPEPMPPEVEKPGGVRERKWDDPGYKAAMQTRHEKYMAWLAIESLRHTPTLEWENVKYEDHTTWLDWKTEMKEAGLSIHEIQRIEVGVAIANCLNEGRVEEARRSFLQGRVAEQ